MFFLLILYTNLNNNFSYKTNLCKKYYLIQFCYFSLFNLLHTNNSLVDINHLHARRSS